MADESLENQIAKLELEVKQLATKHGSTGREIKAVQPADRLLRMRKIFAKSGGILVEDYEHFTRQDASNSPNKAVRKSAKSH